MRKQDPLTKRLERLRKRVAAVDPAHDFLETFEELGTSLEESRVAEEELRQQNEELASTRRALEAERGRYIDLFQSAPDGYLVTDPNGIIREANRAAGAQLRVPPRFLMGKPLANFIVAKHRRAFRAEVTRLRRVYRIADMETRLQPRSGEPFAASVSAATVRDRKGVPVALRWLVRDISARFQHEEQIRSLNVELEQRVALRTLQLERSNASEHSARMAAEEAQRRLVFLAEVSEELSRSFDEDVVLRTVAQQIVPALAEISVFDVLGEDRAIRRVAASAVSGAGPAAEEFERYVPSRKLVRHPVVSVLMSGETAFVPEVTDSWIRSIATSAGDLAFLRAVKVRSWVTVPMTVHGNVLGALTLCRTRPSAPFTRDDVGLAEELARRAAIAIESARLYTREHRIAETLQRSLLPTRLPVVPGVAIAARYLPASPSILGGDWYDVLALPGGRLGIAIGDVAGTGVQAATVMAEMRTALRAYVMEGHSPGAVMTRLNRLLQLGDVARMATLFFLLLKVEERTVRFSNAGHPPPFVSTAAGDARLLQGDPSTPLGVGSHEYPETTLVLDPDSTLLLYTDGLVDGPGKRIDEEVEHLRQGIAGAPSDPEGLCDHVVDVFRTRGAATDDVALLALRVSPRLEERLRLSLPAEPTALPIVRHALTRWLREAGASEDEAFEIVVASAEACANAVQHAYGPGDAEFDVEAGVVDGGIDITVHDGGLWRPARGAHRGRGLALMRQLMEEVRVDRSPSGTVVHLRRRLRRNRGA